MGVASYSCSLLPRPDLVEAGSWLATNPAVGALQMDAWVLRLVGVEGAGHFGLAGVPPAPVGRAAAGFDVGGGGYPAFRIELVEEDGLALGVNDGVEF